jgi:hypothetical protein
MVKPFSLICGSGVGQRWMETFRHSLGEPATFDVNKIQVGADMIMARREDQSFFYLCTVVSQMFADVHGLSSM